jgi:CheY-like chemotaxis protein
VAVAADGEEGVELSRAFHPEVVICDIGLPGTLDGYQVATAMRADPELRGVHLIAFSGYGQAEDKRRAAAAGFDDHLTKPVAPEVLGQVIAEGPGGAGPRALER